VASHPSLTLRKLARQLRADTSTKWGNAALYVAEAGPGSPEMALLHSQSTATSFGEDCRLDSTVGKLALLGRVLRVFLVHCAAPEIKRLS
jgi:hypothetical protein